MAYDRNNVFARILRGELPCTKVYEDEHVLAFHDINPLSPTHILVIPKGRYVSWDDFSAKASDAEKNTAKKFFSTTVLDDTEVKAWADNGSVAIVKGSNAQFSGADAPFLNFVYDTASNAKSFAQSWDQALSPTQAETLLNQIAKLFAVSITPDQWIDNMNKAIGS